MIVLPQNASDDEVLAVVQQWVNLIADRKYEQAKSLLYVDAKRDYPPEKIAKDVSIALAVSIVLPDEVNAHISPIGEAKIHNREPNHYIYRWSNDKNPNIIGGITFYLPISGVWSDVNAEFYIRQVGEGISLELIDIGVI